ncbi:MAG TPA: DUF4340 domain-containing protein [Methylomirabilota bacterium]|nr:DUF4340 domain-containing protein [Methylomirabilota bacterium]
MSWKTLVVLAVLVAGLGGFLIVDNQWLVPKREKAESAKGRLWMVEPKDVESFTIARKDDTIKLKRAGDGWEMVEPVKTRADGGVANEVLTDLTTARVDREIESNPTKLADFGLEPPAATVTLDVKGQTKPFTLTVGGKNPTGVWVYAREGSKPAVVALGESVARDTARPVADFRDKTLVAFDRKNVTAIDLDFGDGSHMTLEPEEGGKWTVARPGPYRADSDLVSDMLERLASARIKEFETAPKSPGTYGLDKPSKLTLWLGKDKDRTAKTILVGKTDADKKGVYVQREGDSEVLLVPSEAWDKVPKTVAMARDKTVFPYAYDKVNRVEIESAGGKVTLERDGVNWKITAPEALKADTGAVNGLLWKIRDLRAVGFLDDTAAGIARYLTKPDVTVRLWEDGVKEAKVLLLGFSNAVRAGELSGVAAPAGTGPVAMVDAKDVKEMAKTATDLRDKTVMADLDMKDVKRIRVTVGDKRLLLERKGQDDWQVLEPTKAPAKEFKVTSLLLALRALKWTEIASPDGADPARYGLDKPNIEVTVLKPDGSEVAALTVGRTDDKLTYVRSKSSPAIYAVEAKSLDDIRKAPADIPG